MQVRVLFENTGLEVEIAHTRCNSKRDERDWCPYEDWMQQNLHYWNQGHGEKEVPVRPIFRFVFLKAKFILALFTGY